MATRQRTKAIGTLVTMFIAYFLPPMGVKLRHQTSTRYGIRQNYGMIVDGMEVQFNIVFHWDCLRSYSIHFCGPQSHYLNRRDGLKDTVDEWVTDALTRLSRTTVPEMVPLIEGAHA